METREFLPSVFAFVSVLIAALGIRSIYSEARNRRTQRRLQEITLGWDLKVDPVIVRDTKLSAIPILHRLLRRFRFTEAIDKMLVQADVSMNVGSFTLLVLTLGGLGVIAGLYIFSRPWIAPPAALLLGLIPFIVVSRKRTSRARRFEEELPDALDLITGALRSGMAFTGALQVVAEESPDPVSKEFTIVFEEHRLGMSLEESLTRLMRRVDTRELGLFVTAVLLQRETGGNLAEILEGTADLIRDRFRILADIRTMTSQARLSGIILAVLPIFMAVLLAILAPWYIKILAQDPLGQHLLITALCLQVIGYFVIRRIIAIKV